MRLLYFQGDGTLAFTDFGRQKPPPYAILSHTWGDGEVTLQDLSYNSASGLAGFRKIVFCAEQAAKDGLKYFWVDTCCIDKNNLPELTRSINSMFRWYRNAAKCYAYLTDVSAPSIENNGDASKAWMEAFTKSRWFTRGWTLQELLAPVSVDFFSKEGHFLGDKSSLEELITATTKIPADALQGRSLDEFSVAERFAWAEQRETTEEEDIAYCLLGIFDVFMPLIYGEGEINALKRLEKLVDESLNDKALGHSGDADSNTKGNSNRATKTQAQTRNGEGKEHMKAYVLNALGNAKALTWKPKVRRHPDAPLVLNHWHRAHSISQEVAQGANAGSIFQEAHVSFLNDVFWDEWPGFETFGDGDEMMADIKRHCEGSKHSPRLATACKYIDAFSSRWTHFFTVGELAMSIDPEWRRTLWGAIRLVFVRCKDYVSMFERLAQMFDKMRERLPSYHDHVLRLRKDCPDAHKSDLGKVLALVYADVLQFCHDACTMFQATPSAIVPSPNSIKSLMFIPFTIAFDDMLERLAEHKRLFDISLRTGRHTDLTGLIERVKDALVEREEFMQEEPIRKNMLKEKMIQDRAFEESVRTWIQSPEYTPDFDKAKDARSASTGAWLQTDPAYVSWRSALWKAGSKSSSREKRSKPVLWLEGPPGFGKTVLSTVIIEDLKNGASTPSADADKRSRNEVVYFYFNAQLPSKQTFEDAVRATAIQVIQSIQKDPTMTDILSLSMLRGSKGRKTASNEDLPEILQLCVRRLSSLVLVLDGVDECQDFEKMWPFLAEACNDQKFRCLFLGRPGSVLTSEQESKVLRRSLVGKNRQDIWNYLHRETKELQQLGHLPNDLHPEYVADTLSSRADSKFLWASLMTSYLRNPLLNPAKRLAVIEDSSQLETLHGLYSGILRQYGALYFEERNLLTKILQFLVLAKTPLLVDQLNIAISIKPGRKLEDTDLLPDFSSTLRRLCGDLIQVYGQVILFSHLSFRSFLQSEDAIDLKNNFRVNSKAGSLQFSVACLSYLINNVPNGPLSGSHETVISQKDLATNLPFSRYAAQHWVHHAVTALHLTPGSTRELISDCYPLVKLLASFMSKKAAISAWIETCWTFHYPASIQSLWTELGFRMEQNNVSGQENSTERRVFESLSKIRVLAEELNSLNEHWSHLLLVKPYEIWGPSISVFMNPQSWAYNDDAEIRTVANDGDDEILEETLLKVSRLSTCGKFIGIVRLSRPNIPREPMPPKPCTCKHKKCTCNHDESPVDFRDAVAHYQILDLKDGFPVVTEVSIDLNPDDLRAVESTAVGKEFRFPIGFAPDLRCISILRTLYFLERDGSLQQQRISILVMDDRPSVSAPMQSRIKSKQRNARNPKMEPSQGPRQRFYKFYFSPCGQYVAHLERQNDMNEYSTGRWDIVIWKKHRITSASVGAAQTPTWKQDARLLDIHSDFTSTGSFAFNPQYLQIALYEETSDSPDQISVWNFGIQRGAWLKTKMIYATGLRNILYSTCGRHVFGDHPVFNNPRIIGVHRHLKDAVKIAVDEAESSGEKMDSDKDSDTDVDMLDMEDSDMEELGFELDTASEDGFTHVTRTALTRLMTGQPQANNVLSTNALTLTTPDGIPELRIVRRQADGGIVMKRLSSAANASENLLHLPKAMGSSTSVSILDSRQEGQGSIEMVLVPDFEDSYTWDNPLNRQSASVIKRSAQSIKTLEYEAGGGEISSIPNNTANLLLKAEEDSQWEPVMSMDRGELNVDDGDLDLDQDGLDFGKDDSDLDMGI